MRQSEEFNGKMLGSHFSQIDFFEDFVVGCLNKISSEKSTSLNSGVRRNLFPLLMDLNLHNFKTDTCSLPDFA